MDDPNTIILERTDNKLFHLIVDKHNIGVGKDYVIVELSGDVLMQLGKLAIDITSSDEIKRLTIKL